jgi:hypothetical protein
MYIVQSAQAAPGADLGSAAEVASTADMQTLAREYPELLSCVAQRMHPTDTWRLARASRCCRFALRDAYAHVSARGRVLRDVCSMRYCERWFASCRVVPANTTQFGISRAIARRHSRLYATDTTYNEQSLNQMHRDACHRRRSDPNAPELLSIYVNSNGSLHCYRLVAGSPLSSKIKIWDVLVDRALEAIVSTVANGYTNIMPTVSLIVAMQALGVRFSLLQFISQRWLFVMLKPYMSDRDMAILARTCRVASVHMRHEIQTNIRE